MTTIAELEKEVQNLKHEVAALRAREGDVVLSDWERAEVQKGLADRLASDEEVQAVLSKYGLQDTL